MTDEQIIKALECCANHIKKGCKQCPYLPRECLKGLKFDSLALIKRQMGEIARLSSQLEDAKQCIYAIEDALDRGADNDWAREEIRRWESVRDKMTEEHKG